MDFKRGKRGRNNDRSPLMDDGIENSVSALEPSISQKDTYKYSTKQSFNDTMRTTTKSKKSKRSKMSESQPGRKKSKRARNDLEHVHVEEAGKRSGRTKKATESTSKAQQHKVLIVSGLGFLVLVGLYLMIAYFVEIFPFAESCNTAVCTEDIEELRFHIRDMFRQSTHFYTNQPNYEHNPGLPDQEPLIATTVRLIFHDCGGPPTEPHDPHYADETGYNLHATALCDGCIELHSNNHGFLEEGAVEPLEELYIALGLQHKMSRSDFWITAGLLALEYSSGPEGINDGRHWPNLGFWFGRVDCDISPDANEGNIRFPGGNDNLHQTEEFFHDILNMSLREAIVNIGAHTLGRPRLSTSGFINHWKCASNLFNNRYYETLIDAPPRERFWEQFQVPDSNMWQWGDIRLGNQNMMLNSDMFLFYNMDDYIDNNGRVTCSVFGDGSGQPLCPLQEEASEIVEEFATNGDQWLWEFAHVYEKMSLTGHHRENMYWVRSCTNARQCIR